MYSTTNIIKKLDRVHYWMFLFATTRMYSAIVFSMHVRSHTQVGDEQGAVEESPRTVEDFLGGVGCVGAPPQPAAADQDHQLVCGELGSITARFLRHYPAAPAGTTVENPGAVTVAAMSSTDVAGAESDQARRPAETFGQRTSIYRGVTRLVDRTTSSDSHACMHLSPNLDEPAIYLVLMHESGATFTSSYVSCFMLLLYEYEWSNYECAMMNPWPVIKLLYFVLINSIYARVD